MINKIVFFIIFLSINSVVFSQIGGTSTYRFLTNTYSARSAALGGGNISLKDGGLGFVRQNPALLTTACHNNLDISYVSYFADVKSGAFLYAYNFKKAGTFAIGTQFINYGKFTRADEIGNKLGEFTAGEYAFNIVWSRPLDVDTLWQIGFDLKPILSEFNEYSSFGITLDAGVSYRSKSALFSAGLIAKNIGGQITPYYESNFEPIPFDLQLGVSQRLAHAPFRFSALFTDLTTWDLTYNIQDTKQYNLFGEEENSENKLEEFSDKLFRHVVLGIEILPSENIHFRIGYNYRRRKELMLDSRPAMVGFSWGFGIKIFKMRINYGRATYHLAGASNFLTIQTNLSEFYTKK